MERANAHLVVVDVVNMGIIGKHANDQSLDIMITLELYELIWNENCNSELFCFFGTHVNGNVSYFFVQGDRISTQMNTIIMILFFFILIEMEIFVTFVHICYDELCIKYE